MTQYSNRFNSPSDELRQDYNSINYEAKNQTEMQMEGITPKMLGYWACKILKSHSCKDRGACIKFTHYLCRKLFLRTLMIRVAI